MFSLFRFRRRKRNDPPDGQPLQVGRQGEDLAGRYLESRGYRILARNYRVRLGEIDLIAEEAGTLAFVEVKARRGSSHGHPAEAVTCHKQRQLAKVALEYLSREGIAERPIRFDVVSIIFGERGAAEIELIQNAFDLTD